MNLPGGGSRKLGVRGQDGVKKYNWPISMLSVDWVRSLWGAGAYQANWIVEDDGKLVPRGRSRTVELDDVGGPAARARHAPPAVAFASEGPYYPAPPPAPPATMPPEVVDMRVRAAEEIASMRLRTQKEIFDERIAWERRQSDDRYERLEERIDELASRRGRDDDDDEPGEWDWLKDLAQQFAPHLKTILPEILKRLGGKPGLPG